MKRMKIVAGTGFVLACALCLSSEAFAQAQPITFNPKGTGTTTTDQVTVQAFDWVPGNALAVLGNPSGGLTVDHQIIFLSQSWLGSLVGPNGVVIALPTDRVFSFVAGAGETVATVSGSPVNNATFTYDPTQTGTNFFEMWVRTAPPFADMLAGQNFGQQLPSAQATRIMYGKVIDMSGNFATAPCANGAIDTFDQNLNNDWPGTLTVCGTGATKVSVEVLSADPNYFPGFGPGQLANLKSFFNTSTVTAFEQTDPSRLFTSNDAGFDGSGTEVLVPPVLGNVNGGPNPPNGPDFQFQADANQSFVPATTVAGGCRVTYGGNDKNGNIAPNSFGQACSTDKGNQQNCYTFGGQVGAPSSNPVFGEHTHHNVSGPAGDFVFHAGSHSAPKSTMITAAVCKDPGACQPAEANAGFKQIDFEGTGSFRNLDPTATAYLSQKAGHPVLPDNQDTQIYYFRVDMDDTGEPGNKPSKKQSDINACGRFLAADLNQALNIPDPRLLVADGGFVNACGTCADVYQFFICKDQNPCDPMYDNKGNPTNPDVIYHVRGFLTGGNIQIHKQIK